MVDENRIVDEGGAVAACAARSLPAAVGARSPGSVAAGCGSRQCLGKSRSSAAVQDNCTVDEGWTGSYGHRRVRTGEADCLTRDLATVPQCSDGHAEPRLGVAAGKSRLRLRVASTGVGIGNRGIDECRELLRRRVATVGSRRRERYPNPGSVPDSRTPKAVQKIALAVSEGRCPMPELVVSGLSSAGVRPSTHEAVPRAGLPSTISGRMASRAWSSPTR